MQPPQNSPDNTETNQQPAYPQTGGEKVVKPLDPGLRAEKPAMINTVATSPSPVLSTNTIIDPTDPNYRVPTLDLSDSTGPRQKSSRVAMQHKSLMGLAIVGLISAAFVAYSGILLNYAINKAILANQDIGAAQTYLDIIWASVFIDTCVNIYFLFAKNPQTVALILKVLLVFSLLSLLGEATGLNSTKGLDFLINGAYTVYIFIVMMTVRTPRPM